MSGFFFKFDPTDDFRNDTNIFNIQSGGSNDMFELVSSSNRRFDRFGAEEFKFDVKFRQISGFFDSQNERIQELFNQLYEFIESKASSTDRVRVVFWHDDLHYPISCPLIAFEQFDINDIVSLIENVCQSKRTLRIDNSLKMSIIIVKLPRGGGSNIQNAFLESNHCVRFVFNPNDSFCSIRAVLIAKAYVDKEAKRNDLCKMNSPELDSRTARVVNDLRLQNQPMTLEIFNRLEAYLCDYRISVFDQKNCIRRGNKSYFNKFIYINYDNGHYNAIVNIKRYFGKNFFCDNCLVAFDSKNQHRMCPNRCLVCQDPKCIPKSSNFICSFCSAVASSKKCLESHQEFQCQVVNKCKKCFMFKKKQHVCVDEKYCQNCRKAVPRKSHRCFVLTEGEKKNIRKSAEIKGYIFFDYEATQENQEHKANLVCAIQLCMQCVSKQIHDFQHLQCPKECGQRTFFDNVSFCSWLFKQPNYTAIAHNMKGI